MKCRRQRPTPMMIIYWKYCLLLGGVSRYEQPQQHTANDENKSINANHLHIERYWIGATMNGKRSIIILWGLRWHWRDWWSMTFQVWSVDGSTIKGLTRPRIKGQTHKGGGEEAVFKKVILLKETFIESSFVRCLSPFPPSEVVSNEKEPLLSVIAIVILTTYPIGLIRYLRCV